MAEGSRASGIDVAGDIVWGSHFCAFYHTKEELLSILIPYVKAGIEGNEACLWVTSGVISAEEAVEELAAVVPDLDARMEKGQVEIIAAVDWYTKNGRFDSKHVLAGWKEKTRLAEERGFEGLRATGDTSWLSIEDWDTFVNYESSIGPETHDLKIMILCSYSLDLWEAYQVIDAVSTHEFALITRDGAWRQIENSERRKSVEKAFLADEMYVLAQKAASIGSWDWDIKTGKLEWSDEIEPMFGFGPGGFAGTYEAFLTRIHPEDRKQVTDAVQACVDEGKEYDIEHRIVWPNGEVRWVSEKGDVIRDAQGKAVRMLGVVRDVTKSKRAQLEIKQLNADLENRTRQLDSMNHELEAFAYSVSHDLRAPLRRIDGFSGILLKESAGKFDKEGERHLERIRVAVKSMDTLIEDILRLSRLSTSDLDVQEVDLGEIGRKTIEGLRAADPRRKVKVDIQKELTVVGDPNLLRIALDNLLGNAWKFTSKRRSAHIMFGVKTVDGERTFFVRDDGVGFDMAQAERIFDPFQRLHGESEFPGSGIGLALVKRIVARHGGRIWAEAELDKGATFYFTLGHAGA